MIRGLIACCIERDLEVLCLLEVQVFTSGGFFEALLEPWRNFEELWRRFEVLEPIWSFEVHKCLIGALWSLHCWRRFWSLRGVLKSFGGALRFWRPSRVWRCTSAGLVLFGGISKHWMCMCAHSSIVSLDLSH
jgi:hypothetical protein